MNIKTPGQIALETYADGLDALCDGRGFGIEHETARNALVDCFNALNGNASAKRILYIVNFHDTSGLVIIPCGTLDKANEIVAGLKRDFGDNSDIEIKETELLC